MIKFFKGLLFFFITLNCYANNGVSNFIKLDKKYKVENTFSGDLSDTDSFHLIFSKDKKSKQYTVHSYLFDGKTIEQLQLLENKSALSVVSFHQKDGVLSILYGFKGAKKKQCLKRVDYNLATKEITESQPFVNEDLLTSIRLKDKSILIYKSKEKFIIHKYVGNSPLVKTEYVFKKKDDKLKSYFKDQNVATIKTDEFVANGSVNQLKLYYNKNTLFFTKDSDDPLVVAVAGFSLNNKKISTTELLKINLTKPKISPEFSMFKRDNEEKFKKATSYFSDDKLFQLALSKKKGFIKIYDVNTSKLLNEITLDNNLSKNILNNPEFKGMEKFLKTAGKNRYNTTITVNNTINDNLKIRVDYVDKTYSYNYDWWWHHQQFMMWSSQQRVFNQMRMNVPKGFGPNPNEYDIVIQPFYVKKEKHYFEFIISKNGDILDNQNVKTLYKEIDKKDYISKLESVKGLRNESSCFLKDSFRYIGYSKGLKGFVIQTNKIK